jgi:hypothetical protein
MGCDGNQHILVKRELLLNVNKQRVDLVGVCVVYGCSDGHRERASGSEYGGDESATTNFEFVPHWLPSYADDDLAQTSFHLHYDQFVSLQVVLFIHKFLWNSY